MKAGRKGDGYGFAKKPDPTRLLLAAACLLPGLLLACATERGPLPVPAALLQEDPFDARYKVHCDTVSGKTVCVMTGNALRPFNPRYPMLSLGVVSEVDVGGPPRYFLRTVFVNEKRWLNIGRGGTLRIVIDGEAVEFSGDGSRGSRYTGEREKLYEVARYETSAEIIKKIAAAREVLVSVKGEFPLEKSFGNVNNLYFQQFVRHYIDKTPTPGK
jgi:hypothetical protein